jgi:peptidoglycan/LPS O-acetylase OafA/YrhL
MVRLVPVNTGWRTTLSYASFLITVGTFLVFQEFVLPNGEWDWRALGALVAIGVGGSLLLTATQDLRGDEGSGLSLAILLSGAVLVPLGVYLGATAEQGWRFLGGSLAALFVLGLVGTLLPEEEDEQADEEYGLRDEQFDEELLRNPRVF